MSRFVRKDTFFHKAKQEGFRARSAYKLNEIQERFRLVKTGNRVLDLGCAPGSFLQILSTLVGPKGLVVGIDILPLKPLNTGNISVISADIREVDVRALLEAQNIPYFDVITCDIAPNLSGIREVDDSNVLDIYEGVRNIISKALKPGGSLVMKTFFSETFTQISSDLKKIFNKVAIFKPVASRSVSSETYFICTNKK